MKTKSIICFFLSIVLFVGFQFEILTGMEENVSSQTTNLHLVKPAAAENVSRTVINNNYDIIDTQVKSAQDAAAAAQTTANSLSGQIAKQIGESDLDELAQFKQGGWLSIDSYTNGSTNTSSSRLWWELSDTYITTIKIHVDSGYRYIYALYDSNHNLIRSSGSTASSWLTSDTDAVLNTPCTYIRFTMAINSTTNVPIAVEESSHCSISTNNNKQQIISINKRVETIEEKTNALNDKVVWQQGGWLYINDYVNGSTNTSSSRINYSLNNIDVERVVFHVDSGYKYTYACFDKDHNLLSTSGTGANDWKKSDIDLHFSNHCTYIRFTLANDTATNTPIAITAGVHAFVSKGNDIDTSGNPVRLKVCSYNVGLYSFGRGDWTKQEDAIPNLKSFLCSNQFDVIGIQENEYTVNSVDTNNSIFGYLYNSSIDGDNHAPCIKSQYKLKNTGTGIMRTSNRKYAYGTIDVGGRDIFVICVHFALTASDREDNYTELLEILNGHDRYIVFGDFNAGLENDGTGYAQSEFDNMINAGAKAANGGFKGLFNTRANGNSHVSDLVRYLDNIFVSSNIIIADSGTIDTAQTMNSDHIPVYADLVIVD